jgi:hypothetical protein
MELGLNRAASSLRLDVRWCAFARRRWPWSSLGSRAFDGVTGSTETGDSGGPLFCGGKVVAVNSCGNFPDWFARLDAAKPWVEAMLERWDPEAASQLVR